MNIMMTNKKRPDATEAMHPNELISRKLRELYDSVEEEGIPDRFVDLLVKLDEAEQASKK